MNRNEQKIIAYLVRHSGARLGDAVARLGGERARAGLRKAFDEALAGTGLEAGAEPFRVEVGAADWDDAAALLRAMTEHAAGVIGVHTVEREMARLLDAVDEKLGASQYEIYFRLGLHGYRQD